METSTNAAPPVPLARLVVPLRVLRLTLKRQWFDMIASGEKKEEYREPKSWIFSRLSGKEYDVVEFANGYGPNVPTMEVEYLGWELRFGGCGEWGAVSNQRYVVIHLGRVLSLHNEKCAGDPPTRTSTEANQ